MRGRHQRQNVIQAGLELRPCDWRDEQSGKYTISTWLSGELRRDLVIWVPRIWAQFHGFPLDIDNNMVDSGDENIRFSV